MHVHAWQAYVDFFYLTHRPDQQPESTGEEGADEGDHPGMPTEKLPLVKTQLSEAEVARRRGDTKTVYASYAKLAALFGDLDDQVSRLAARACACRLA